MGSEGAGIATPSGIFEFLMESQRWKREGFVSFQRSQLEQLLRHARNHVPFYQTRLDCLFDRFGNIDWEKWREVPILTRAEVAAHHEALQARELPPGHGKTKVMTTSGSTGLPISVRFTRLLTDAGQAADWRAQANWKMDWSKPLFYWERVPQDRAPPPDKPIGQWGPPARNGETRGAAHIADSEIALASRMQWMRAVGARYLFSQGNFAMAAALALSGSNDHHPLHVIQIHGIAADESFRALARKAFGASIMAMYSSKEAGRMAHQCPACSNYHVNAEMVHLEILDDRNEPCPPGVPGRVVVTSFFNAAQPFIRYEQGDIATWEKDCVCGTPLPVLRSIDGRIYHLFRRRDGTAYAPQVMDEFRAVLGATLWQFVQTSADEILVRYMPAQARDPERETAFARLLKDILREDYSIRFETVSAVPLTAGGKYIKYLYAADGPRPAA